MSKKLTKNFKKALEAFDNDAIYSLQEAVQIAQKIAFTKFDSSLELAFKLNLDTRKADQQLRGSLSLPYGTGKNIIVLVASDDEAVLKASKSAGADFVVNKFELEEIIKAGKFEFDIIVADPKMMPTLGKYGKVLGPKGLMPNPKIGTVTPNPPKAVDEIKKGKANYRAEKAGIVHSLFGKVSMDTAKLVENAQAIIETIIKLKPSVVKGTYIQNLTLSSSMGPAIKIKLDK